jgi:Bacteriophage head to tail connecting protein
MAENSLPTGASGTEEPAAKPMGRAKSTYERLDSYRWMSLERARDCSALTLPALIPPQNTTDQTALPTPFQSVGSRGVNNLASKLLMALFPPGLPCFRLKVNEAVANNLGDKLSDVEGKLASVERIINDKLETEHTRPLIAEVLKHLIVGGNALLHAPTKDAMRFFRLDQFVICRDAMDRPLHAVIKESTVAGSLDPLTALACQVGKQDPYFKVDVFTFIEWDYITKKVCSFQEINGMIVPGSDTDRPLDKSEWIPLRWIAVPGRDYGRGHVEEYLGDLRSLEGLSESIVQFAQAAAKIVMLVHANSTTSVKELNNAESGDAITGSKADIDMLQLEKAQDFEVANKVAERIEQRISYAFLLRSGATRDAERVTAEEVREMAQELEDALGGVYTVLAHEMQLPLIQRFMAVMTQAGSIPAMPKGVVMPVIVTGFEALGRNHALNKLRSYFQDLSEVFGQQVLAMRVDFTEVSKRYGSGYGIEKPEDLWKTDDQVAQDQKQQTMRDVATKGAPQLVKAVTDSAGIGK